MNSTEEENNEHDTNENPHVNKTPLTVEVLLCDAHTKNTWSSAVTGPAESHSCAGCGVHLRHNVVQINLTCHALVKPSICREVPPGLGMNCLFELAFHLSCSSQPEVEIATRVRDFSVDV